MSFDAGSIESRLSVDTAAFNRTLDEAKAKVKAFEDERHEVKISAVFDNSATARARETFARLDQQLTSDALARMRTSPQGSVLGSLNALLAPQSESLQQGSLGNITRPGGTVTQQTSGGAQNVSTTDRVNVVGDLPADGEITTTDHVNVEGLPPEHSDITTTDHVKVEGEVPEDGGTITTVDQVKVEGEVPKDGGTITTTDKIELDEASAAKVKAEADAIGNKKETISVGVSGGPEAAAELAAVSAAEKDTSGNSETLRQRLSSFTTGLKLFGSAAEDGAKKSESLGEKLGFLGTPMGALVAAGTALAPVIVTAGVGIGGFAAAAVGAVKPILDAAQATGGLQGNLQTLNPAQQQAARGLLALEDQYSSFSKALAPEVFQVFNTGLKTASTLLHDVAPVAAAAGKGLDSVLAAVNTDLNSAEWKQFFTWMAQNAAPDIELLGSTIGALVNDLPPLLEALQPVGVAFLNVTTYAAKLLDGILGLGKAFKDSFTQPQQGNWLNWLTQHIPAGNKTLLDLFNNLLNTATGTDKVTDSTDKAAAAQRAAVTAASDLSANLATLEDRYGLSASQAQALVTAAGQTDKALQGSGDSANAAMKAIEQYADASLNAKSPSQQLADAIAVLDNNTLGATVQLDAFNTAWGILVGNSVSDQQAVLNTAQAFDSYNSTVKQSGTDSTAAQQAFLGIISTMGTGLSTLEKNGASVDQLNSFYQTNIDKLNALHDLSPQQQADVQSVTRDYDTWASSTDGLNNKLLTAAGTIRTSFTAGLQEIGKDTPAINTDMKNLADAILKTGTQSSATAGNRAQLIKDLENAGVDAQTAKGLVKALEDQISTLKGKNVAVGADVNPAITALHNLQTAMTQIHDKTVTITVQQSGAIAAGFAGVVRTGMATGGLITTGTGPVADDVLVRVSKGETVVSADTSKQLAPVFAAHGVPGYASGGIPSTGAVPSYSLSYGGDSGHGYMPGTRGSGTVLPAGGATFTDVVARLDQIHADNQRLIRATEQVPAGVGRHVGGAINGAASAASFRARYPRSN